MHLHKGEILFRQGDSGQLYHLKSGLLKIIRVHEDGVPFLMNIITPDEMIPHHSLISPHPYNGTAIALVSCEVEPVPASQWYRELEQDPAKCRDIALPASGQAAHDAKANRSINRSDAGREASKAVGLVQDLYWPGTDYGCPHAGGNRPVPRTSAGNG